MNVQLTRRIMEKYSLHDFDDGRGPVPAHRHPNGGGWVENTATVAPTAYVGPHAQVKLFAQVLDKARVEARGLITDSAILSDIAVCRGEIRCGTRIEGNMLVPEGMVACTAR